MLSLSCILYLSHTPPPLPLPLSSPTRYHTLPILPHSALHLFVLFDPPFHCLKTLPPCLPSSPSPFSLFSLPFLCFSLPLSSLTPNPKDMTKRILRSDHAHTCAWCVCYVTYLRRWGLCAWVCGCTGMWMADVGAVRWECGRRIEWLWILV